MIISYPIQNFLYFVHICLIICLGKTVYAYNDFSFSFNKTVINNKKTDNKETFDFANVDLEELLEMPISGIASKRNQKLTEVPASVIVITQNDIESKPFTNLPDLIRSYSGFLVQQVSNNQYSIGTRGLAPITNPSLLVLIDGRIIIDDTFGHVSWNTLPVELDNIKQIEIVKGPISGLYGAGAVSGVINILTKSADDLNGHFIKIQSGVIVGNEQINHTEKIIASTGFSNKNNTKKILLSLNIIRTPELTKSKSYQWLEEDDLLNNYLKLAGLIKSGIQVDKDIDINLDISTVKYNGPVLYETIDPVQQEDSFELVAKTDVNWNNILYKKSNLKLSYDFKYKEIKFKKLRTRNLNIFMHHTSIQIDLPLFETMITSTGAEFRLIKPESEALNKNMNESLYYSMFLQNEFKLLKKFIINTVVRTDLITRGKNEENVIHYSTNPRGNIVYLINENNSLRFGIAYAFRMPTIQEQFGFDEETLNIQDYPNIPPRPVLVGNPFLYPETVFSIELGYVGKLFNKLKINYTAFYQKLDNLICYSDIVYIPQTMFNSKTLISYGSEAGLIFTLNKNLNTYFNFTISKIKDEKSEMFIKDWPLIIANIGSSYKPISKLLISFNFNYQHKRESEILYRPFVLMNMQTKLITQKIEEKSLMDIRIQYKFNKLLYAGLTFSKILSLFKDENKSYLYYNNNDLLSHSILPVKSTIWFDISLKSF